MRKELTLKIIERIKQSGKYCDLMSNGTLIDENVAEKLVSYELDRILISLDGPSASVNDFLRGEGAFSKTIEGIKNIQKAKERFNSDKPKIQISSVINSMNSSYIKELFELAKVLEVDELELHQMLVYESTEERVGDLKLDRREKENLTQKINKLENEAEESEIRFDGDALKISFEDESEPSDDSEEYFCLQPFYTLLVDMLGEVAPCCPGGSSSEDVGLPQRSLEDVWYGEYLSSIRENVSQGKRMKFCANCGVNNLREDLKRAIN